MDEIKSKLRTYILSHFLPGESAGNLKDDTPLRTSGIIDSLGIIQLVSFVEDSFGIELEAHETGVEHFDRIEDLAALVASKLET
jgi:acyl carrier protein